MKRYKKIVAVLGVAVALVLSIVPRYTAYAEENQPESQAVTSDDNIVQKILYFAQSNFGALTRAETSINKWPEYLSNACKEKIAELMNGGGIYVDDDGNYVFSDDASQQIYDAMTGNSNMDAKVVSDFSSFSYLADGYVNAQHVANCNEITAWARDSSGLSGGTTGNYMLYAYRQENASYINTYLYSYKLPNNFAYFVCSLNQAYQLTGYNTSSSQISGSVYAYRYCYCNYNKSNGSYNAYITNASNSIGVTGSPVLYPSNLDLNGYYNSFPNFKSYICQTDRNFSASYNNYPMPFNYYCNNSLILAKNSVSGNAMLMPTNNDYITYNNIGTVSKTIIEENNWENIYNNFIVNVNTDYQENTGITPEELRKIQRKYSQQIIQAIEEGSNNIEETISISNRYLQAISVDVRNIIDWLQANGGSGGGGSGSNPSGLTPEQANTLIALLNQIDNNCLDIANGVARVPDIADDTSGIYLETQDISDNTASMNSELVAMHTVLNQINSKIRNRNTQPRPDPDFWDNLIDELDDYSDTKWEQLTSALQMIGTVLSGVAPFGYIAVMGGVLNSLAVEPEPPVFMVELDTDSGRIPVHYQGQIDFTWIDDILPMIRAFEVIIFLLGLLWASFEVYNTLANLLG